ncbi:MAG: M23 family metallopeptidase [Romboutsia sp.]|uniref:M23 family metallopeptidase n=1 Tax=Romboutsia sp. TaxID=1965302 RepID=UPI003F2C5506
MKKNTKTVIALMILSLSFFIIKDNRIYAFSKEANLDSLIQNKENQKEIKNKLGKLEEELGNKKMYLENEEEINSESVEVVSISFVQSTYLEERDIIDNEIEAIEEEKLQLEKELEQSMIDETRIEKAIEEEKKAYLNTNNIDFIPGIWPVPSYIDVSSRFGERIHPITGTLNFHRGIDIPAPQDVDIVATDDGIVLFSGVQNGYGNVVKIKHFDGKKSVYAHNNSNLVKEGDVIKKGQPIAKIGTTGDSTGNHLHFETIVNDKNINPINVVN